MAHINGKPFLQHQLEYIERFGLKDILILTGYMGEQIMEYLEDGSKFDLNIQYSRENNPLGTGGALQNARNKLENEFLLLNGDTFMPINYPELIDLYHRNNTLATITVYSNQDLIIKNNITTDEDDLVSRYSKRESKGMRYVDSGVIALKKKIVDLIPQDRNCSLEEEIYIQLIEMKEMKTYITDQRFYDMGSQEGITLMEKILS